VLIVPPTSGATPRLLPLAYASDAGNLGRAGVLLFFFTAWSVDGAGGGLQPRVVTSRFAFTDGLLRRPRAKVLYVRRPTPIDIAKRPRASLLAASASTSELGRQFRLSKRPIPELGGLSDCYKKALSRGLASRWRNGPSATASPTQETVSVLL
jgi:hypothetical protein